MSAAPGGGENASVVPESVVPESVVRDVVIVGRDAPLWLSACTLQVALAPAGVQVTVVELPPLTQPADVCISLPALEALHTRLRIHEAKLVTATRAAFAVGLPRATASSS